MKRDLSCTHGTFKVIYLENNDGAVELSICTNPLCAKIFTLCEHKRSNWNSEETVLICNLCGRDGT